MAPYNNARRIVSSYPGKDTGDTIYVDECGTRWLSPAIPQCASPTTGVTYGTVRDGFIVPEGK